MTDRLARETLATQIATELEISSQFVTHVEPDDADYIALVRSAGRLAGRMLGWRVRTFQTDPAHRADGRVVVLVVAVETTPEDAERFESQGVALLQDALSGFPFVDLGTTPPTAL